MSGGQSRWRDSPVGLILLGWEHVGCVQGAAEGGGGVSHSSHGNLQGTVTTLLVSHQIHMLNPQPSM